jgi:F-type H+-transporting ATPase subunit c
MVKKLMLTVFIVLALSVTVSAEEGVANNVKDATPLFLWSIIIGVIGLTLASIGGAYAQSKALSTSVENIGRNPAAADSIRGVLILGLVLIESLVIYVLLIDLIIFFVKWGKYTF